MKKTWFVVVDVGGGVGGDRIVHGFYRGLVRYGSCDGSFPFAN